MQVKFRGKRVDGGGWVEGNLIKHIDSLGELWLIEEYIADYTYKKHQVYQSSIGMFTNIHDKNGKEIYGAIGEKGGDILTTGDRKVNFVVYFGENTFDSAKASFCFKSIKTDKSYPIDNSVAIMEIIGNAFDNPELLEK